MGKERGERGNKKKKTMLKKKKKWENIKCKKKS